MSAVRLAGVHARLFLVLARPALVVLLTLFGALGVAHAGGAMGGLAGLLAVVPVALVVAGYLVAAVAMNDLSDEAVDRINLPDDARRPLVTGRATRLQMEVVAAAGAVIALAASAWIGAPCFALTAVGLVLAALYSLPPVRLAKRGLVAPLLLPVFYVGVPFLAGVLSVRSVRPGDLVLLGGLYVTFVGRILLKDFRDVRGDALLGKRTALVRHGRVVTCCLSALFWVAGSAAVVVVRDPSPALVIGYALEVAAVVPLIWLLARSSDHRRDERLISTIALIGRGQIVTLLLHYGLLGSAAWFAALNLVAFVTLVLGSAYVMVAYGPRQRVRATTAWAKSERACLAGPSGSGASESTAASA